MFLDIYSKEGINNQRKNERMVSSLVICIVLEAV